MAGQEMTLLKALIYSDIFHFPLTREELFRFAETEARFDETAFLRAMQKLNPLVVQKDGFFCLPGQEENITNRRKNEKWQLEKVHIAQKTAAFLSRIPSVLFIGISGAVAAGNAKKDDDIDLFVITADSTLWVTRFLLLCLLQIIGRRRVRNTVDARNTICLNMLCEEKYIQLRRDRRDIYTAREFVQMIPLFSRGGTYQKLVRENAWVAAFLANGYALLGQQGIKEAPVIHVFANFLSLPFIEWPAYRLQRLFMERHRTTETVERGFLAFHPKDYRKEVLADFEAKMQATGY